MKEDLGDEIMVVVIEGVGVERGRVAECIVNGILGRDERENGEGEGWPYTLFSLVNKIFFSWGS